MKRKLLVTFFLSWTLSSFAQKNPFIKVFAYSQSYTQGRVPSKIIGENGTEITQKIRSPVNYLIYLEYMKRANIVCRQVWINGQGYNVKTEAIKKTPVELVNNSVSDQAQKMILVPKTQNEVIHVALSGEIHPMFKLPASVISLIQSSDLVISYTWKARTYYSSIKKITLLNAVVTQ